jgi:hypothetical protein
MVPPENHEEKTHAIHPAGLSERIRLAGADEGRTAPPAGGVQSVHGGYDEGGSLEEQQRTPAHIVGYDGAGGAVRQIQKRGC